jgi:hypothetical protein
VEPEVVAGALGEEGAAGEARSRCSRSGRRCRHAESVYPDLCLASNCRSRRARAQAPPPRDLEALESEPATAPPWGRDEWSVATSGACGQDACWRREGGGGVPVTGTKAASTRSAVQTPSQRLPTWGSMARAAKGRRRRRRMDLGALTERDGDGGRPRRWR